MFLKLVILESEFLCFSQATITCQLAHIQIKYKVTLWVDELSARDFCSVNVMVVVLTFKHSLRGDRIPSARDLISLDQEALCDAIRATSGRTSTKA